MDEELIGMTTEVEIGVGVAEEVTQEVEVAVESVHVAVAEVEDIPTVSEPAIIEVAIEEGEGYVAGKSGLHSTLPDRNEPNQHVIESITGLRTELNWIQSPRTIESNGINVATYYEWEDAAYDTHGYFVSLVPGTSKIEICKGSEIFGVSIKEAGFIGGQDAKVPRDSSYGLIVTSGLVDVRCELDVEVGDYVVSNTRGYAEKSTSNFGYKVLAKENKNGVEYAVIALGVQADEIDKMGTYLNEVKEQVDANYKNIISAVNVANQAYQKVTEIDVSNKVMSDKVDGALDTVGKLEGDVENLGNQASNSALISAQAKAIAESAATSAESMRNEAVEKANKALADTSELRKEFEAKAAEIDTDLENTVLELEATKEEFNETINGLKLDTEGQLADFKKEVEDNYATTTQLAAVKTENSDAVAALKQEVSDTYATIESVASLKTESSDALAGFKQEVSEVYATQEMLTSLETETSKALTDYKQEVTDTYATQEMVSKLETDTTKALTDYKQEVADTYATQEMTTKLETDTSKALSDYKQEVTDTYATQTSLATLRTDTAKAITASEEKAAATYASKSDLTSFESNTNVAMARIEQKADANGAYIQSTVSNMDKYAVGPYSQAYGFTLEQASSVLEEGMIYVPTIDKTGDDKESYSYTDAEGNPQTSNREFLKGYLYRWGKLSSGLYGWITIDRDYSKDKLNTSAPAVYFDTIEPSVSGDFGYWYTDGDDVVEGYESYTLYKWDLPYKYQVKNDETGELEDIEEYRWVAVATLAGNSQSRAVSQIRQDANSIALDVTNVKGDLAGIKIWAGDDFAAIQDTVTWKTSNSETIATTIQKATDSEAYIAQIASVKNDDGTINAAASIVTAVNEDSSGVTIEADHINLKGYVTVSDLSGEKTTEINGANIMTGTVTANHINANTLRSNNYDVGTAKSTDEPYVPSTGHSAAGTAFDLSTGAIYAPYFYLGEDGKINARGGGTIGGWSIGTSSLYNTKNSYDDNNVGVYLGTDGIGLGKGAFYVTNAGAMTATTGTIGGWSIDPEYLAKGRAGILSGDSDGAIRFFAGLSPTGRTRTINASAQVNSYGYIEAVCPIDYFLSENFAYEIGTIQYTKNGEGLSATIAEFEQLFVYRVSSTKLKIQGKLPVDHPAVGRMMEFQLYCMVNDPKFAVYNDGRLELTSKGGKRFVISVDESGNLTTTEVH